MATKRSQARQNAYLSKPQREVMKQDALILVRLANRTQRWLANRTQRWPANRTHGHQKGSHCARAERTHRGTIDRILSATTVRILSAERTHRRPTPKPSRSCGANPRRVRSRHLCPVGSTHTRAGMTAFGGYRDQDWSNNNRDLGRWGDYPLEEYPDDRAVRAAGPRWRSRDQIGGNHARLRREEKLPRSAVPSPPRASMGFGAWVDAREASLAPVSKEPVSVRGEKREGTGFSRSRRWLTAQLCGPTTSRKGRVERRSSRADRVAHSNGNSHDSVLGLQQKIGATGFEPVTSCTPSKRANPSCATPRLSARLAGPCGADFP